MILGVTSSSNSVLSIDHSTHQGCSEQGCERPLTGSRRDDVNEWKRKEQHHHDVHHCCGIDDQQATGEIVMMCLEEKIGSSSTSLRLKNEEEGFGEHSTQDKREDGGSGRDVSVRRRASMLCVHVPMVTRGT